VIRRHLGGGDIPAEVRVALDDESVGAIVCDQSRIHEANDRFLQIVGYARGDLDAGALSWLRMTEARWMVDDARAIGQLRATGRADAYEKEFVRADGHKVRVLVADLLLEIEPLRIFAFVAPVDDEEALRLTRLVDAATRERQA
jgi:PAS domain S-box-containing protein